MNSIAKTFRKAEEGYILILGLILLPVFLLFALLIIDVGRGNNAHADLQAAADAVALTGARELDGRDDAITRAKVAMAELDNTVNMLGTGSDSSIELTYADSAGNEFAVTFLTDIPDSDNTAITTTWLSSYATTQGANANFVYVRAQSRNLATMFGSLLSPSAESVPIGAVAVATNPGPVACNVTPIFICNPFDDGNSTTYGADEDFEARFAAGDFYGRLFEMHLDNPTGPGPGNFGFLRVGGGNGGNVLQNALAAGDARACFTTDGVDTEPGQTWGPVETGINTHFGLYAGDLNKAEIINNPIFRPARNVRMAQTQGGGANECKTYSPVTDGSAMALPQGDNMVAITGGLMSDDDALNGIDFYDWDIDGYWIANYGDPVTNPSAIAKPANSVILADNTYPKAALPAGLVPSRYDVHRYEISQSSLLNHAALSGEIGRPQTASPQCTTLDVFNSIYDGPEYRERRTIFAAVVNCRDHNMSGATTDLPSVGFVRMFLTKPAVQDGSDKYLSLEIIDATGPGGSGSIDELVRSESILVR